MAFVFVPSRGFLFFYDRLNAYENEVVEFSSPHGDFSFSIMICYVRFIETKQFSSPHGDFSFSIITFAGYQLRQKSFRPLTGISLFLLS